MKELSVKCICLIMFIAILLLLISDLIDITQYFYADFDTNSIISNFITFESIIIGFISTIYVMIQSLPNSNVKNLLLENNRLADFNRYFEAIFGVGILNILLLIGLQFIILLNNIISKIYLNVSIVFTILFVLLTNNIIAIMLLMIKYESESEKKQNNKMKDSDFN